MNNPSQPPNDPGQWFTLANQLRDAGKLADAIRAYQCALTLDPNFAPALVNLGTVYAMQAAWRPAIAVYQKAIQLVPNVAALYFNLGSALELDSQWSQALSAFQRTVELNPADATAWTHVGQLQFLLGQHTQGLLSLRRAVSLQPDDPIPHLALANTLLTMGFWQEGWREFEWRLTANAGLNRHFSQPQGDGSPIPGKTLLLHAEGGHGDALQFVRYVPLAAQSRANLVLECHPALFELFKQVPDISTLIPRGQPLPHFDVHIPLAGMARIFGTTEQTIPAASPYLTAPPARIKKFSLHVPSDPVLKVGLVWSGKTLQNDPRTNSVETFAPLASIPGIHFFKLQKGTAAAQPSPPGMNLIDLTAHIDDFADLAGLLAHLDLLISADTAPAHLAGAMAKPVWVLIPQRNPDRSDFRWLLDRDDSPWYPSMRLFRQKILDDWSAPVAEMAAELKNILNTKK
jgi:Flp pilus assembly protein TadD